jgi:peptidyl-prolyl cis-trans isomerase C
MNTNIDEQGETTMKRTALTAAAMLTLAQIATAQMFGPAATVGETEIPRAKVEAQVNHLVNLRGLGSGGITQPSTYRQIQEEVVEQLIVQELLWQEAQRREFVASDEEVDAELSGLKENFDSQQTFEFRIKEGGFTEASFRENIRQQRSVQKMIAGDIIPAIEIDDAEIQAFYDANLDKMQVDEQVRARHILIKLEPDADDAARAEAMAKIQSVQEELDAGASFAIMAIEHSEGPSAPQGGDLGYFGRGQMVPTFEAVAFALEPGDVSGAVETQFGFHLIKVEDHVEKSAVDLDTARPQIENYLGQQKLEESIETLVETLRADNKVEVHLW